MVELEKKTGGEEGNNAEKKLSEVTAEKQEIMMKLQALQLELEKQKNLTEVCILFYNHWLVSSWVLVALSISLPFFNSILVM